jgi:uncharacterized membrane protein
MNIYKKRREEQERQEQARIAAKEAEERAEKEKYYRREEKQRCLKKLAKRMIGPMVTLVPFILGVILYNIACKESRYIIFNSGPVIAALIFLVILLVLIHFRKFFIFSIIAFVLVALYNTTSSNEFDLFYKSFLVMLAALIVAIVYPKDKYWD